MVEKKDKKTVEVPDKKPSYFPKLMIVGSLLLIIVAVVNVTGLYGVPSFIIDILLIFAGAWLLITGINKGFNKSHREILKKYI